MDIVSTCPWCGAPIYAQVIDNTSAYATPTVHYTCDCRRSVGLWVQQQRPWPHDSNVRKQEDRG